MKKTDAGGEGPVVWDITIRVFHWALVLLVFLMWLTAENNLMNWHRRFGLTVMGLLVFRLYWGFFGVGPALFARFVKGPAAIFAYLATLKRPYTLQNGHNPLGALSVLALLAVLSAQVTAGLFAVDVDGVESGPLSHLVSFETGRAAAELHETMFNVLLGLIALHIAAIAYFFFFLKANLVRAMMTGRHGPPATGEGPPGSEPEGALPVMRFLIGVVLAIASVWLVAGVL